MESPTDHQTNSGGALPGDGPSPSTISLIIGVFTSPTQAFGEFKKRPRLLVPLIVTIVLMAIGGAIGAKYNNMAQYDMMKKSTTLPPAVLEEMRQNALDSGPVTGAITPAVAVVVINLLAALVAWFLGSFVFGGKSNFKAVWATCIMGGLIPVAGGLLKLPLMYAKDTMQVSYGLAALMPGKDFTSILYSLLFYLDVFAIWGVIVTGIGYAAIFGLTKGKGITMSAIVTLIFVGLLIGMTAFGMSFAGVEMSFL